MEQIYKRLTAVFRDVFDDEEIELRPETTAADIIGWDSLEHITLVSVIEEEFGIKFNLKVSNSFHNVGEMAEEICRLLGE